MFGTLITHKNIRLIAQAKDFHRGISLTFYREQFLHQNSVCFLFMEFDRDSETIILVTQFEALNINQTAFFSISNV